MTHPVKVLVDRFSDLIIDVKNIENAHFSSIDSAVNCHADSLVFIDDKSHIPRNDPGVVVTRPDIAKELGEKSFCIIVSNNVRLAQAKVKQVYQDYDSVDSEWPDIHESAVVHASAQLGTSVRIGPNVVIGANAVIGEGTQIRANSVIEHDVNIGTQCIINSHVNIGYGCVLGDRVNIHSGTIIGNEGFGFAQDDSRKYHRIPHTGWVELHDDVQVGANSNIDRGTYGATILGKGVKLDSLCHIAHNVHIDEGTVLASQACVAGSTYIGKRVTASGQVGILDHLKIADDVILVHRSGVTDNIENSGMYGGVPAKPFKEHVRTLRASKRIDKLSEQVKELKKNLLG